jgi:ketosteroid isomerase-like protein
VSRTAVRANIEPVMAWLGAMRRKDLNAALACFAPTVVWEGLVPGVECPDRNAVREMLSESIDVDIDVEHLEVIGGKDHAVLGVRSPQLDELAEVKLNGQLFNVFTIEGDQIVRVHDFATRSEALQAADLDDLASWR